MKTIESEDERRSVSMGVKEENNNFPDDLKDSKNWHDFSE